MTDECDNCGETLKVGMLSSNQSLSEQALRLINMTASEEVTAACNRCGDSLFATARTKLAGESARLKKSITAALQLMPVVSIHSPEGWKYDVIGMVTAQSVTGTGIFSDVASAFTDLFGSQSGTYNAKLREGEDLCKASLRAQALEAGGNAVVAADIDYAEVGGQRAMLMVCMTGTAVRLTNTDRISGEFGERTALLADQAKQLRSITTAMNAAQSSN